LQFLSVCRLQQLDMASRRTVVLVSLLVATPAVIFWLWLVILPAIVAILCPEGCWCDPGGNYVNCSNSSLNSITVTFHTDVRTLKLDYIKLTSLKKDSFVSRGLTQLERLSTKSCGIVRVEPGAFNGLINLVQLSLMNNMIQGIEPRTFENMTTLEELYLVNNKIENLEPDSFWGLSSLDGIWLDTNKIGYLHPEVFINLPNLSILSLRGNQMLQIPTDGHFISSNSLTYLGIPKCNVSSVSFQTFAKLTALKVLDLSRNDIQSIDINISTTVLPKLSALYLYDNPLQCDCQLQEVWRWCQEHNIETAYEGQAPECDTPSEVKGISWGVLEKAQCLEDNISYHGDYEHKTYKYSDEIHDEYMQRYIKYMTFVKYVQTSIYAALFIFGTTGNVILLIIITCNKDMRTVPNMYILNLAVSDIISLTINLPLSHANFMSNTWQYGEFMCKFFEFSRRLSVGLSAYSVAVLSIQRYNVTVNSFHIFVSSPTTCRVTMATICGVWIVAALFALPSALSKHADTQCSHYRSETYYEKVAVFELLVSCVLPLCVIAFSYIMTARHLLKSARPISQESQNPQANARKNIAKIVLGLGVVFLISYVPYHILWTYIVFNDYIEEMEIMYTYSASTCLLVLNSCFNPVALCCSSLAFRRQFKRYLTCCCKRKSPHAAIELTKST
jgi:hypothetical protein